MGNGKTNQQTNIPAYFREEFLEVEHKVSAGRTAEAKLAKTREAARRLTLRLILHAMEI